ncbi:hypothetical protein [Burkholderia stabilis]|uniref:hypothetical protein n=1 Tax=Burkholderia stabilis TaxID=95485 RepID=UPI0012EA025B|nr:hypothetical protein [Burkholderia stabilis]HDR9490082.1 hypothetical protein [Burkholderia stabilis]HDR9521636.1 hypothetical protein [Burkholderia stabilis]HDR9537187.1 hypothetical protein [Burkholderia stabilis]HDR9575133.1 hypothetical protein [Burkholderia stabilis]HDR9583469.1 hypothetical protein [Burkholderia stabilis]
MQIRLITDSWLPVPQRFLVLLFSLLRPCSMANSCRDGARFGKVSMIGMLKEGETHIEAGDACRMLGNAYQRSPVPVHAMAR